LAAFNYLYVPVSELGETVSQTPEEEDKHHPHSSGHAAILPQQEPGTPGVGGKDIENVQHKDVVTPMQQGSGPNTVRFQPQPASGKAHPDGENGEADQAVYQRGVPQPDVRINNQGIVPDSPDQAGNKRGFGKASKLDHFRDEETAPCDLFQQGGQNAAEQQSHQDDQKVGWKLAIIGAPTDQPYQAISDQTVNDRYHQSKDKVLDLTRFPSDRTEASFEDEVGDHRSQTGSKHQKTGRTGLPPVNRPGPDDGDIGQGAENNGQRQENDNLAQYILFCLHGDSFRVISRKIIAQAGMTFNRGITVQDIMKKNHQPQKDPCNVVPTGLLLDSYPIAVPAAIQIGIPPLPYTGPNSASWR
jgi:hypothetical protein